MASEDTKMPRSVRNSMASPDDKMTGSIRSGGFDEVLNDLQGSVYFAKKLSATNALRQPSRSRRYGQLVIPRSFVCTHGDKFQRDVELRSDLTCNKPWPFRLSFCPSRGVPEVAFNGKAWVSFLTSHGLVQSDQVVFSLTAMSKFQVYMFNSLGDPKGPQTIHTLMKWSEAIEPPHKFESSRKCEDKKSGLARKKVKIEDAKFVACPSNNTPIQNSPMNKTPLQSQKYLSKSIKCLPSFSRRLGSSNIRRLEISRSFVAAHRGQLHDPIQLQGIHADSPVYNNIRLICYSDNGLDRLFLQGTSWVDFVRENELCFGQELVLTLTADSYFIVKREVSWSPKYGLNLKSHTPMVPKTEGSPSVATKTSLDGSLATNARSTKAVASDGSED